VKIVCAQEPDKVGLLNRDMIKIAFDSTFKGQELKRALECSFVLQAHIRWDGQLYASNIVRPDSSSVVYKRRNILLREIENRIRVEFYSDDYREKIKRSEGVYCIAMIISKGLIIDYENVPYKCK
jgi:hypothetical protein